MLLHRSIIKAADNSGAVKLMLIGIPAAAKKKVAKLGDLITCVVKEAQPAGQVKKSEIVRAVIVRTKKETRREDGSYIRFSDNAAVLVDKSGNLIGSRIFGPVAAELRQKGFGKIVSAASEVW